MTDLNQLLTSSTPIFDPEHMTREILFARLTSWLDRSYIDTLTLNDLRALVRDLSGEPAENRGPFNVPVQVAVLSWIEYAQFSPLNRRHALNVTMTYAGLTDETGPELLGAARWQQVQEVIEAKVAGLSEKVEPELSFTGESAPAQPTTLFQEATPVATQWSQKAVARRVLQFLDEPYAVCLYEVEMVRMAVNELRALQGMSQIGKSARDAGLQALSGVSLQTMDAESFYSLPNAILDALALDNASGPLLFGAELWADIFGRFALGMTCENRAIQALEDQPQKVPSFWARFWRSGFQKNNRNKTRSETYD